MKTIKRSAVALTLCLAFAALLAACDSQGTREIALNAFLNDQGAYEYKDAALGSTFSAVEKSLGRPLGQAFESADGGGRKGYVVAGVYECNGIQANVGYEFADDKLRSMVFRFDGGGTELFDYITDKLNAVYGAPTDSAIKSADLEPSDEAYDYLGQHVETTRHRWESASEDDNSLLQLSITQGINIGTLVQLGVNIFP
ncbi:MAG: hypothetical protein LBI19_01710 [Oscillospiraceae bacterium]|nr:hypothetical protein [Oscillospiraceae bacterium]